MTIVGEAFIVISPEGATARTFATKLDSELKGTNVAGTLDKQFANAGLTGGNAYASKFTNALRIGGLSGGTVFGAAIAVGAVAGLAAIGAQFQKVRAQIQQETGATGAQLTTLANDATQAFRAVPVSLSAAASAIDELRRRGEPLGPQLEQLGQQELFLAKITGEQVAPVVDSTTALFGKFNIAAKDQSRELDVLFKASQQSGKGFDTLTSGLTTGAASLQKFGFSLDTSAALLATLEKAGFNVTPVLAALRLGFGKIAQQGGDPTKVLAGLVKELTDGVDPAKGMADAIHLFGTRSGVELATAIQKGALSTSGLLKIITDGKKGIVATGLATLTLGDQFKLLRNNIEADLAGAGTVVLHDLETGLKDAAGPVETLATGFGHLFIAVAPVVETFPLFLAPLRLLLPVVSDFGTGLSVIASGLEALPTPVRDVVVGVGGLAIAVQVFGVDLLATAGSAATFGETMAGVGATLLENPFFLAVAGVTLLGGAFHALGNESRAVAAEAKDISSALFVTTNSTTLLASGVKNVTTGLTDYLKAGTGASHVSATLQTAIIGAESNTGALAKAVTSSAAAWDKYKASVLATALQTGGPHGRGFITDLSASLDDQRVAFQKSAQQTLKNAEANDTLTTSQVASAEAATKNRDGTTNYAAALNLLNTELSKNAITQDRVTAAKDSTGIAERKLAIQLAAGAITDDQAKTALTGLGFSADAVGTQLDKLKAKATEINQVQDLAATRALSTSGAYRDLARQVATGSIVEQDAEGHLQKMGFSAAGAKTAFSDLQSAISTFVSTAVGAIPSAVDAISTIKNATATDKTKLTSDLAQQKSLQQQLSSSLQNQAAATSKSVTTINLKIAQDQKAIVAGSVHTTTGLDSDLRRRTLILQTAAATGGKASATLTNAILANNKKIHDDYAKLVADNDPAKFTKIIIANTVQTAQFMTNLQKLVSENFGQLAGTLATQGPVAAGALAAGFASDKSKAAVANAAVILGQQTTNKYADFLKQKFPELSLASQQVGNQVGAGIGSGLTKELLKLFPQLRPILVGVGKSIADTVGDTLSNHDEGFARFGTDGANLITENIRKTLAAHRENITGLFVGLGHDADTGVAQGIADKTIDVTKAINKMADGAIAAARKSFRSHSPSQVAFEIGGDFSTGLANGLTASTSVVTDAMGALATTASTSFSKTLGAGLSKATTGTVSAAFGQVKHGTGASLGGDQNLEQILKVISQRFSGKQSPTPITPHPSLVAAGLALTEQVGSSRLDAIEQQQAAQRVQSKLPPPVTGPVFPPGAFVFNEKVDPLHVGAEVAWAIRHGTDT